MSKNTYIGLIFVIVVALVGVAVWQILGSGAEVKEAQKEAPDSVTEAAPAQPEEPALVVEEPAVVAAKEPEEAPAEPGPAVAPEAVEEVSTEGAPKLTAETLSGTSWKQDNIAVKFHSDGQWEMNGRVCAKWEVQGSRVRIYDGQGEEHFVDIAGDTLEFEGKKIGRVTN